GPVRSLVENRSENGCPRTPPHPAGRHSGAGIVAVRHQPWRFTSHSSWIGQLVTFFALLHPIAEVNMNKLLGSFSKTYNFFAQTCNHLQSPFLLAVRMYWGWQFFQTGYGKLMDIPRVTDFFTSLNVPFPMFNAYLVGISECVGGILLFVGLGSRLIALPLAADMIGAYLTADREALSAIFSDPGKFYNADPYT